ncbi:hypothetical protein DNTS_020538 [Danionella cerebrum]|uniref:IQ domain-containing protein C n=1 Tax=Danionella cerebrum TaxID=2873325 RepID=A0A553QA64_9TELE|nr:hypothetical protein DNTS_020538 [Danionella translucida]
MRRGKRPLGGIIDFHVNRNVTLPVREENINSRAMAITRKKEWFLTLTKFQAQCRGFVIRRGLSLVRDHFEKVVFEIDGGLDHLLWRGNIIPQPHFTDTESLLLRHEHSRFQIQGCLDHSERREDVENKESVNSLHQSEVLVPERDKAPDASSRNSCASVNVAENKQEDSVVLQNLPDDDSSENTQPCRFQTVLKDSANTHESLKQQRSTLAMELLWIQQAISSRKKYLALKQRMDVSQ